MKLVLCLDQVLSGRIDLVRVQSLRLEVVHRPHELGLPSTRYLRLDYHTGMV